MAFDLQDYHLDATTERVGILLKVLQYDSEVERCFTTGERICINQQRGDLLRFKSYLFGEADHSEVRYYELPPIIEITVDVIAGRIKRNFWQPMEEQVPDFR